MLDKKRVLIILYRWSREKLSELLNKHKNKCMIFLSQNENAFLNNKKTKTITITTTAQQLVC
jgi:hypothetical protein